MGGWAHRGRWASREAPGCSAEMEREAERAERAGGRGHQRRDTVP